MFLPPCLHKKGCVGDTKTKVSGPLGENTPAHIQLRIDRHHLGKKEKIKREKIIVEDATNAPKNKSVLIQLCYYKEVQAKKEIFISFFYTVFLSGFLLDY
jgi:hypothetical protein